MKNGLPLLFVLDFNKSLSVVESNESSAAAISYLLRLCSFLADIDNEVGFVATPKSPTLSGNRSPNRWPPATPSPSERSSDSDSDGRFSDESFVSYYSAAYSN